jgi:hypothetical protein
VVVVEIEVGAEKEDEREDKSVSDSRYIGPGLMKMVGGTWLAVTWSMEEG